MDPARLRSKEYQRQLHVVEVGATSGLEHQDVLERALGHERGLRLSSGMTCTEPPLVVGGSDVAPSVEETA